MFINTLILKIRKSKNYSQFEIEAYCHTFSKIAHKHLNPFLTAVKNIISYLAA